MPNKELLAVGINKYPNAPLNGCVNDAKDWAAFFEARGYKTTMLFDGTASKATIMDLLRAGVSRLKYRDTFVFQFSGHGSWVPDFSGDEPDGRDEVLCAYDYENDGLIYDDEIYEVASPRAFGSKVIILSDSCHSGSIHRLLPQRVVSTPLVEGQIGRERIRYMPPINFLTGNDLQRAHEAYMMPVRRNVPRRGTVLISGCADNEYSYDAWINGRYNGAFSHHAIRSHEAHFNMKQWHEAIRRRLPTASYPQTPQLHATWYQKNMWRF